MSYWYENIKKPPSENILRTCRQGEWSAFVKEGTFISQNIIDEINTRIDKKINSLNILEFGCGCGRVSLPFYFNTGGGLTHACDVDPSGTSYLASVLDKVDVKVSNFKPPLPYEDEFFEVVYSISVWTHLTEKDQISWLEEMRRIIKPGGFLIFSTGGWTSIESRKKQGIKSWQQITKEDFESAGILYFESETLNHSGHKKKYFPGITSSYGQTSNTKEYIKQKWSTNFDVLSHRENALKVQDLCTFRRR